ncbi:Fic family protein [Longimicrobium sp.]|uniref:Fic family protein n=1 Tax=Longimicrobium sp. TaxID=2029185 RepID=UPI002B73E832|nr:Fic family protein [Longimicrobium sp.]HSU14513.1 Fic family protein [Longimicrobium sp.]
MADLAKSVQLGGKAVEIMGVGPAPDGKYLHWDELRHRQPPSNLSLEEWWFGVKLARSIALKPIPLRDKAGRPFKYMLPDSVLRLLHIIDQNASGGIQLAEEVTNPGTRDRYIVNSLIEESITSSQLEGASTTAEVARDMIRSGRRPIDRSERMILNNFAAMRFVQENRANPLTPALVFELHRIVTDGTLDDGKSAGEFRTDEDDIVVSDPYGNTLHVPPPAGELPDRMAAMCEFANSKGTDGAFMYPVVRAILLHFWLAFDHPFVDGNGRTARALFYWSMLADRYWLAEYISISRILKKAPGQYGRAFLFTETDDNDLTYFVLYQLSVIDRAIEDLKAYLRKKMAELREVQALLKRSADLNHRQLALLGHALKHPGRSYTVQSHQTSHRISTGTARTDLLDLTARHLLDKRKAGKAFIFTAAEDLPTRLKASSAEKVSPPRNATGRPD